MKSRWRDLLFASVLILAWLAFPVLVVDFQDGWWYACFGRSMVERGRLWVPVTEKIFEGTVFHRPAWLYALWAYGALSLSPVVWLLLEVLVFGGLTAFLLWKLGQSLGLSRAARIVSLLFAGWFVFPEQWLRPQIALVPLVVGLWLWIQRDLEGKSPPVGWIFLISLAAANLHGGVLLLGVFLSIWAVMSRDPRRVVRTGLAWALGSSLHPYFPEPWRTNLEFGFHPPHVTEWEPLISRVASEGVGAVMLWLVPPVVLVLIFLRFRRISVMRFLLLSTMLMFVLAWLKASRFVTWAMLGLCLLLPAAWPERLKIPRSVGMGMLAGLVMLGLLRFPWVEDRIQLHALQKIPAPKGLTWGAGRVAHVLCWAWPRTPLTHTGLDAVHLSLTEARALGARFAVTHAQENQTVEHFFLSESFFYGRDGDTVRLIMRSGPYALWEFPPSRD